MAEIPEAYVFDALRTPRGRGKASGSLYEVKPVSLVVGLIDEMRARHPELDTGQVDDSAGRALNPEHFAIAAGTGINVLYDFLGFFPGRAYIELATRLDRDQTDFQVLFGTRQAF